MKRKINIHLGKYNYIRRAIISCWNSLNMVASRLYDVKTSKTLAAWAHATFYIKKRIKNV